MRETWLTRGLTLLARFGADPDESDEARLQKMLLVPAAIGGFGVILIWGLAYQFFNEPFAAGLLWFQEMLSVLSLIGFGLHWWRFRTFYLAQALLILVMPFLISLSLGGVVPSSGIVIWCLLAPLGALVVGSLPEAGRFFLAYAIVIVVELGVQPYLQPTNHLPAGLQLFFWGLNLIIPTTFIFWVLYYFVRQRNLAFRLLRGEQEKSENLLLNILPKDIAAILKNENRIIADHFEGASILFADVVNFTPMSANMKPVELVELLNAVFSHFDTLVEQHGLEKIKTIGDCYMVAAGVPRPRADHAQVLARLALEMRDYVAEHEFNGRRLVFRIGLNSGPVVAGVIGRKKFIYDLWGDAVNTASRMESHGSGGAIQITRSTYDLIKDEFDCEPRGRVNVKGKGEMDVWLVTGVK